jgi:hypothetical protein
VSDLGVDHGDQIFPGHRCVGQAAFDDQFTLSLARQRQGYSFGIRLCRIVAFLPAGHFFLDHPVVTVVGENANLGTLHFLVLQLRGRQAARFMRGRKVDPVSPAACGLLRNVSARRLFVALQKGPTCQRRRVDSGPPPIHRLVLNLFAPVARNSLTQLWRPSSLIDVSRNTLGCPAYGKNAQPPMELLRFRLTAVGTAVETRGRHVRRRRHGRRDTTLGAGLMSGLRTGDDETEYIQITALLSAGSSGGGLFDDRGNLIGVTSFTIRDAQNLNFAIAASQFWR